MAAKKKGTTTQPARQPSMMRVEITEARLSDTDADTGKHYQQVQGDVITVPDAYGRKLCGLGWAKDVEGTVPTGERIPGAAQLAPRKKVITSAARGNR